MEFFLVSTDHLSDRLWFRDDNDYKAGMNLVAAVASLTGVNVLAFILMSNHVHFVLECSESKARLFINQFKKYHGQYLSNKYGSKKVLRRVGIDIRLIDPIDESLERAIAYVLMNCVAANICLNASDYPWGSGASYFRLSPVKGQKLHELSSRAQIRLLHCKASLPDDYLVLEDGYIAPESYVKTAFVESLFRSPKRMNYFLINSSKAKKVLALGETAMPSFKDQVVLSATIDMCHSIFHKNQISDLNGDQRVKLVRQIHRRFSSNVNQISRVTGIPDKEVAEMLDRFW